MFTKDIGRIGFSWDVVESNYLGSNGLSYSMEGQSVVSLVQLGMRTGRAFYDRLVVPKHLAFLTDWHPKISEGKAKVNGLFKARTCGNELGAIGSSLDCSLFLGEPVNGCLVDQV